MSLLLERQITSFDLTMKGDSDLARLGLGDAKVVLDAYMNYKILNLQQATKELLLTLTLDNVSIVMQLVPDELQESVIELAETQYQHQQRFSLWPSMEQDRSQTMRLRDRYLIGISAVLTWRDYQKGNVA